MDRSIDVYNGKGVKIAKLSDASISAVPAAAAFHPTMDWIAGATGSGKLCLFVPPEV
jgi:WD repeat-containing protein 76